MKQLSKLIDQTIENNKNYYSTKSYWTHYNIAKNISIHITSKSKLANFSKKLDCLLFTMIILLIMIMDIWVILMDLLIIHIHGKSNSILLLSI